MTEVKKNTETQAVTEPNNGEAQGASSAEGTFIADEEELGRALEAVLFAAGYPMEMSRLSEVFARDKRDIRRFVESHTLKFNSKNMGIMMLIIEDKVQMCTREEYKDYIRQALGIKMSGRLSPATLEVLALVAYNQPVTKAYIEQIRGVDCSYAISSLLDKGLIEVKDRLDVPGRPMLYGTTDAFFRCFGIESLSELPGIAQDESDKGEVENPEELKEQFEQIGF